MDNETVSDVSGAASGAPACTPDAGRAPDGRVTTGGNGLPEVRLSDGRVARFTRKPKGRDAELAFDAAGKKQNSLRVTALLLSRIVEIDGRAHNAEELLDLDLSDLNLLGESLAGNF